MLYIVPWPCSGDILKIVFRVFLIVCTIALAGKFKKKSKKLGSLLKRCEYDVRSTKKNLGSIGGSLEEPQPKHVHWCLAQRFAHCMSFARQFADLKDTPVCLTFDPLGLQMTTIAQNDRNLLRILNFGVKKFFK